MDARVLVATDLSESADEAVRQAHERALRLGGTLTVLHVIPNLMRSDPVFPQDDQDVEQRWMSLREKALVELDKRVEALTAPDAGEPDLIVEDGSPPVVIVREAEMRRVDLLVVGSHGRTDVSSMVLGNVAEKVIRHAHCPVLVARPHRGSGGVLVATDFSDSSLAAVAAAVQEARLRSTRLAIVHSVDLSPGLTTGLSLAVGVASFVAPPEIPAQLRDAVDDMLADALARCDGEGDRVVEEGPPADAIVRVAEQLGSDLIVVGTVGRTGLPRLLLGSVAEAVVRSARCSVLVVRLPDAE